MRVFEFRLVMGDVRAFLDSIHGVLFYHSCIAEYPEIRAQSFAIRVVSGVRPLPIFLQPEEFLLYRSCITPRFKRDERGMDKEQVERGLGIQDGLFASSRFPQEPKVVIPVRVQENLSGWEFVPE